MRKILLGFIGIGLLTFVGCKKDEGNSKSSGIQYGAGAIDIDGNTYQSVIIGNQEWMVENLRTSKYSDGTAIPNVVGNSQWSSLSTGAWCHYENDSSQYEVTYGKLYNWYAVNTNKLCPTSWHVPTDAEWTVLTNYVASDGHSGAEGKALKATSGWNAYNVTGTDDYGFLGLPGGYRSSSNGDFYNFGSMGGWWNSSQLSTDVAWDRSLGSFDGLVYRDGSVKKNGFSVRCLRD